MEINQHDEVMAKLYEQAFPGPKGELLAALTREQGELLYRMDELDEKIQGTSDSDDDLLKKLLREFMQVVKQSDRIATKIKNKLKILLLYHSGMST